jgi:hypothetical protein
VINGQAFGHVARPEAAGWALPEHAVRRCRA